MKQLMMERDQRSATAMEWGHEKDRLLVGYNSGKVLAFSVQFDKVGFVGTAALIKRLCLHDQYPVLPQ